MATEHKQHRFVKHKQKRNNVAFINKHHIFAT